MESWVETVIAFVTGGGLLALIGALTKWYDNHKKGKKQTVDERIDFWEGIAKRNEDAITTLEEKYETRINNMEERLEQHEANVQILLNHITQLEHTLLRISPEAEIPPRPVLYASPRWNGVDRRNDANE